MSLLDDESMETRSTLGPGQQQLDDFTNDDLGSIASSLGGSVRQHASFPPGFDAASVDKASVGKASLSSAGGASQESSQAAGSSPTTVCTAQTNLDHTLDDGFVPGQSGFVDEGEEEEEGADERSATDTETGTETGTEVSEPLGAGWGHGLQFTDGSTLDSRSLGHGDHDDGSLSLASARSDLSSVRHHASFPPGFDPGSQDRASLAASDLAPSLSFDRFAATASSDLDGSTLDADLDTGFVPGKATLDPDESNEEATRESSRAPSREEEGDFTDASSLDTSRSLDTRNSLLSVGELTPGGAFTGSFPSGFEASQDRMLRSVSLRGSSVGADGADSELSTGRSRDSLSSLGRELTAGYAPGLGAWLMADAEDAEGRGGNDDDDDEKEEEEEEHDDFPGRPQVKAMRRAPLDDSSASGSTSSSASRTDRDPAMAAAANKRRAKRGVVQKLPASEKSAKRLVADAEVKERQRRLNRVAQKKKAAQCSQLMTIKESLQDDAASKTAEQYRSLGLPVPAALAQGRTGDAGGGGDGGCGDGLGDDGSLATSGRGSRGARSGRGGLSLVTGEGSTLEAEASGGSSRPRTAPDLEQLVDRPRDGYECYICKVRQAGCPLCWDFPTWVRKPKTPKSRPPTDAGRSRSGTAAGRDLAPIEVPVPPLCPRDYAFTPGMTEDVGGFVAAGGDLIRPPLHTCLTTNKAIKLYRACFRSYCTFNVKTVPAGPVCSVVLDMETSTVYELYERFRANARDGDEAFVHLYLPTEGGIFSLCNQDDQETDLQRANVNAFEPLSSYHIGTVSQAHQMSSAGSAKTAATYDDSRQRAFAAKSRPPGSAWEDPNAPHTVSILYYPW